MKKIILFLLLLTFADVAVQAQCYNRCRSMGIEKYNARDYAKAKDCFVNAKQCPDKPYSDDLDTWIRKCENPTPPEGTILGHDYVDLNLPSGTLWATCNVGASLPSDYGNYYAWGEVSTKNEYNYSNLQYCNDSDGYSFSKYNEGIETRGTRDGRICLEMSDDAARANWGGDWRMPTHEEWVELIDNCIWVWTTQGGHYGYKITSKGNGRYIFLPAAGSLLGNYRYAGVYKYGSYWSSSLSPGAASHSYKCELDSVNVDPNFWGSRQCGLPVRPVVSLFQN